MCLQWSSNIHEPLKNKVSNSVPQSDGILSTDYFLYFVRKSIQVNTSVNYRHNILKTDEWSWGLMWKSCQQKTMKLRLRLYMPERHVRSGGIAPLILNLSIRWRWEVKFTTWPLYQLYKSPCTHGIRGCVNHTPRLDTLKETKILTSLSPAGNKIIIPRISSP